MAIARDYQPEYQPPIKKAKAVTNGWTHGGLITDLCENVNGTDYICGEVYAGSRFLERRPCPDALRVRMSYSRPDFAIYEIKVSRPDFLSDLRSDKWQTYLPYCSRFYFATPEKGVATIEDIPFVAGWMVRGEKGWRTIKTPKVRQFEPDFHYALALLISEQKYRVRAENLAAANRKMAHGHNVSWSKKVIDRVRVTEEAIKNNWESRKKIMSAKAAIKRHFGIDVGEYWRFNDMDSIFKDMKMGLDAADVTQMRANLKMLSGILDRVAGKEKAPETIDWNAKKE
jgi:hypothetical protein